MNHEPELDLGPWVHEWATCRTIDVTGDLHEYCTMPTARFSAWCLVEGRTEYIKTIDITGHNWRELSWERKEGE